MNEESPEDKQGVEEDTQEDKEVTIRSSELETLRGEWREFKDKYWRLLAESENTRKRMQKERDGDRRYAIQGVILDILHPLDQLEQALEHSNKASEEVQHWATGFKMILIQFKDALASHGVRPFHAEGKAFDPHRHEAVEMVETEKVPPDTIVEELLKGYTMGDQTLRPARVRVAKAPSEPQPEEQDGNKNSTE